MSDVESIRWLHLSDLHLGGRGQSLWWEVHGELAESVRREVARLGAPDLILITGDLAFSGKPRTHEGFDAVRDAFRDTWKEPPPPDMKLVLDRADRDGEHVKADWTCTSPVFPAPMKGYDLFTIRDGKIARLEIVVIEG